MNHPRDWWSGPLDPGQEIFHPPEHVFHRAPGAFPGNLAPTVDIQDGGASYILRAEVPGIPRDRIQLSVTPRTVSLSAQVEETSQLESQEGHFIHQERSRSHFHRTFTLPQKVDPDQVRASFQDGLLTVELPKAEAHQKRDVQIDDGRER